MLDLGVLALILGTVAMPIAGAWAAVDYTISTAVPATNGGNPAPVLATGDTLTITATGSVTTTGQDESGLQTTVDGTTITHNGPIRTTGRRAYGIYAGTYASPITGNATILGLGDIATAGDYADGILSGATGSATISTGNISTTGSQAYGIRSIVFTGNATITAGDISTQGFDGKGIYSYVGNGNATITVGNISTLGFVGAGLDIRVDAGNATITAGDISTQGYSARGIVLDLSNVGTTNLSIVNNHRIAITADDGIFLSTLNDHVQIVNTGTISSAATYGIHSWTFSSGSGYGSGTIITNSGTISGYLGAVKFTRTGNTLSLLAGSKIVGLLDIAGTGGNTLSIGQGIKNTALAYTNNQPVIIETNGALYVAAGGVLAVYDPTPFAAADGIATTLINDLTGALGNLVEARLATTTARSIGTIGVSTSNAQALGSQWQTWAARIGTHRQQGADGSSDGFDTTLGGFVLGGDTVLSSGIRFGAFVGTSHGQIIPEGASAPSDSDGTHAGIYAGYTLPDAFVNLALTGGYTNAPSTSRDVMDNMVDGGVAQAKAAPKGIFIAPQATIGTEIKTGSGTATPSLRIAYTRLMMHSHADTGSTANMSFDARTVSTVDLRGQVAFAFNPIITSAGQFDATMRLGVDTSFTSSDEITATLLGQPITLSAASSNTKIRGFAGLDLAQAMSNDAKLNLSVEAGYGTNSAVTLQGTAGLVWAF